MNISETLDEKLRRYASEDVTPFHMPGHKRRNVCDEDEEWNRVYRYDITEIDGFDDLHDPQGIIADIEVGYAKIYNANRAYLSVNGATAAIEAAVFAATAQGDMVIATRCAHKSFYHTAALRDLKMRWVYPAITSEATGISETPGALDMTYGLQLVETDILRAIDEYSNASLLFLTTPDYLGYQISLAQIVSRAHEASMKVVVDAAHGAHIPFAPFCGENPLHSGADYVIMSIHKTLPALTQTALLLENGNNTGGQIREYLDWFMSSSPSYILLSGASRCLSFLETRARGEFKEYKKRLYDFYEEADALKRLGIVDAPTKDRSKIIIDTAGSGLTGIFIAKRLREDYRIETEAAGIAWTLALSSVMDDDAALRRLLKALYDLDSRIIRGEFKDYAGGADKFGMSDIKRKAYGSPRSAVVSPKEALAKHKTDIRLLDAAGQISASNIMPYPPGIPVATVGEVIDEAAIEAISAFIEAGIDVKGISADSNGNIFVSVVG